MYSSIIRSCVKVNQNTMTETKAYENELRHLKPMQCYFLLFMNDLPEYFRAHINCPGVKLGTQSLNCLMYTGNLLIVSNSLEGLQQSLSRDYLW